MTRSSAGTLYLVPTPIGNLEDMTLRAIRILKEVDLIFCEDTRRTGTLCQHFEVNTARESLFVGNEHGKTPRVLDLLQEGKDLALVTDAGTPAIADPGYLVVRACRQAGLTVVPLPGASALSTALAGAGLPTDRVHFWGFLPRKSGERLRLLTQALVEEATVVFYESPHRIHATLDDLAKLEPERKVVLCRELSKLHESIQENTAGGWLEDLPPTKGEFVLLLAPRDVKPTVEEDPVARYHHLLQDHFAPRAALKIAAKEAGLKTKDLYDRIHRPDQSGG